MSIKDTLPEVNDPITPLHYAVRLITHALVVEKDVYVRLALAHVRAARKALPEQGRRVDDYPDRYTDTRLLSLAGQHLLHMLGGPGLIDAYGLRVVEAQLRSWLKRRRFRVYGTGHPMAAGYDAWHVGTFQTHGGHGVWHVFEAEDDLFDEEER